MDKRLTIVIIVLILMGLGIWWLMDSDVFEEPSEASRVVELSHEQAELTGFNFMRDFTAIAPPDSDPDAMERVYNVLSKSAREQVSRETLVSDMAFFVGVQAAPDQGVSVQNLFVSDEGTAVLVVGLNYSGGMTLKNVNLVIEEDSWKVDSVTDRAEGAAGLPAEEIPAVIKTVEFAGEASGVDRGDISIISVTEQDWPDGCLGLGGPDEMCAMAIVPGYEITLMIEEEQRIFRADEDGDIIKEDLGNL